MRVQINEVKVGTRKRKLDEERVRELAESIRELGLLQPIGIRADGTLVFGWHRLEACRLLGWAEIEATVVSPEDALRSELAEIDENLIRNELTALERAEHLARRKEIYERLYPYAKPELQRLKGLKPFRNTPLELSVCDTCLTTPSRDTVSRLANGNQLQQTDSFVRATAKKTGISERSIRRDIQIVNAIPPEVRDAIRETPLADSKRELLELARLDAEEQMRVVRVLVQGAADSVTDAVRRIRKQERIAELERQREAIESGRLAVPEGLFDVIVIDPPWPYGTEYDPYTRRAASPYPEMSLEEIRAIRLPAKEDCVLWLWTTHLFMRHAFAILDAWGFREVAILTWVKDRLGLGSWLRSKSEFCIMAVKGKPVVNLTNQSTVLFAPMREHSRKPDEFYEMVETLCPGRKLDFFSREPRRGWEQYGNDTERFK
jgi:N6-adenosine-specific RNA methylase IME4